MNQVCICHVSAIADVENDKVASTGIEGDRDRSVVARHVLGNAVRDRFDRPVRDGKQVGAIAVMVSVVGEITAVLITIGAQQNPVDREAKSASMRSFWATRL